MKSKVLNIFENKIKKKLIVLVFLSIFFVFIETFLISLFLPLLQNFFSETDQSSYLFKLLKNFKIDQTTLILIIFIIVILRFFYYLFFNYFKNSLLQDLQKSISLKIFFNFFTFKNYNEYISYNSSNLIRDLIKEVTTFKKFIDLVITLSVEFLIVLVISIFLINVNFKIFLTIFILLLLVGIFYILILHKRLSSLGEKRLFISKNIIQNITESFRFFEIIKIHKKLNFFYDKNSILQSKFKSILVKISIFQVLPKIIIETLFYVGILGAILFIFKSSNLQIESSVMGVFFVGFLRIYPSVTRIIHGFQNLSLLEKPVEVIYNQLNTKKEILETSNETSLSFKDSINISNLDFKYKSKYIFNDFNVEFKKNSINAIIGSSGSGKSTLIKILLGLVSPEKIKIQIDKKNVDYSKFKSFFSSKTGYSGQENLSLNSSIYENITLKSDYQKGLEPNSKVKKAFMSSGLDKFFDFNNDLNQVIDENGKNLSGGQLQRISLSRSIYFSSGILILDEICSSLDLQSESEIIEILKNLSSEYLILYITHRHNFLDKFDQVIKIN